MLNCDDYNAQNITCRAGKLGSCSACSIAVFCPIHIICIFYEIQRGEIKFFSKFCISAEIIEESNIKRCV